jgi:hypothetical protein
VTGVARRAGWGVLAWVLVTAALRVSLAAPERCPEVTVAQLEAAAAEAVAWFERNQEPDGTWLYGYDRTADLVDASYNIVRHAGVALSLAQAARDGYAGAAAVRDRGLEYALGSLVDAGAGRAFALAGSAVDAGASALLVAALIERRLDTGDTAHDVDLAALGRFLAGQVEPDGRVLARFDSRTGAPVPEETSPFFTGEIFWALARLHAVFPDEGWDQPVGRIARYVALERDDREPRFPPVSDHWSAYAYAEVAAWPGGSALTADDVAYAHRQAGIFSVQVRNESQKANELLELTHGGDVLGAGVGTWGEGLGALWRAAGHEAALAPIRNRVGERARCVAGLLVERQVSAGQAAGDARPEVTRGAWFADGRTQMDDQQHALSALLGAVPIVGPGPPGEEAPA